MMNNIQELVDEFEKKLTSAVREKYSRQNSDLTPEHQELFLQSNSVLNFDISTFVKEYLLSDFPKDRISKLAHALFDVKLELFFIGEFDIGLYNNLLYLNGYNPENPSPLESLKKMSLDQNVIVKTRILWERMINFVSIFISGDELEASHRKSKKKQFSKLIEDTPWIFLKDYWKTLEWFDDHLRTPEVHSGSVLRKYFQTNNEQFDDGKIIVLYNIAINLFYPNLMAITRGLDPPYKVWTIGMVEPSTSPNLDS